MDSHDTLSFRLADILVKLNNGEKLDPYQLAQEYKVNLRTIQRDLNERLGVLPLQHEKGLYCLESFYLGKLTLKDIKNLGLFILRLLHLLFVMFCLEKCF